MDVRSTILEAGSTLLRVHGIAALTQPRVAAAAGVKQSHLTYYFPKRADLLIGIATHTVDGLLAHLAERIENRPTSTAFLDVFSTAILDGLPPRIMIGLAVAADEEPALRAPLDGLIGHVRARIRSLLEHLGVANPAEAALLIHATVAGLAVMHHARRSDESARDVRDGIAAILARLAVPTEPSTPSPTPSPPLGDPP